MSAGLREIVRRFAGVRVVVIGEAILDVYLQGDSHRLCREAPVPVVDLARRDVAPGGAANTAANLARLGAQVVFVSVVGADREAALLRRLLTDAGVGLDHLVVEHDRVTMAKHRLVADGQMLVRFDLGSRDAVGATAEARVCEALAAVDGGCDAIAVSDYGYGVLTPRVLAALAALQARAPRVLVVDAKDLSSYRRVGVTAVKPNYHEAAGLLGEPAAPGPERADRMAEHGQRLLDLTGAGIVAVTLDSEGALVFERGRAPYRTYAEPTTHARAAGAGDTFVAALTLALAAGAHTPAATEIASAAAAIVVGKPGTTSCSVAELDEYLAGPGKLIADAGRLEACVARHRAAGRRLVFTNGCFDLLHGGHITYLNAAKELGDVLVVGINTDDTVRRLKGSGRPINTLAERAEVLAALSCVDHIVPFDEDTPEVIIRKVRPDIFVKGGDYVRERLPEAAVVEALGGEVRLLPYVANRSTTGIIERIRSAEAELRREEA